MSTHRKEIEYKYDATEVPLDIFKLACASLHPVGSSESSGYDHFYSNGTDSFCRHRQGSDVNQLTFKKKLNKLNVVRTEHNVDLAHSTAKDTVRDLCEALGYKYKGTIFKNNFVFIYEKFVLSYYLVYNKDMTELGRFLEIEATENWPWKEEKEALEMLDSVAEKLSYCIDYDLGFSQRIRKSLFEMFSD
jgi:adenylate cyclase class IV